MNLDKLRGIMAERRVTQKELASKLNLTPKSVSEKLTGKSKITVDEAFIMAKFLAIENPQDIFFDNSVA